jgi:CRP/FNR family cyclic AMP-dependent transcriptional regulator
LGIVHQEVQNQAPSIWETVLGDAAPQAYVPAGELVFRAGESPSLALIRAGLVRVFIGTDGGRQQTIRYARPGDLIGLAPLLGGSRAWSAEAIVQTTISQPTLEQLRAAAALHPELPWLIAEDLATWACVGVAALADSSSQSMVTRVARHLEAIALRGPDGRAVARISHQRLADAVGTVREVISRQLQALRADGVIETQPGRVILVDEDRLADIAEGRVTPGTDAATGTAEGPSPPG